tara:strand:- start:84 stop:986 length:903 start_codon:yes stop_codon:yes gene_type:complete
MKNNSINQLAIDYFLEKGKAKKFGILLKAEKLLNQYQFSSYSRFKKDFGFAYFAGINTSQKTIKGIKENYNTLILYLSASKNAGKDLCSFATTGCRMACLEDSGQAALDIHKKIPTVKPSRIKKSWICIYRPDIAEKVLQHEIDSGFRKSKLQGRKFSVRLNGTSDLNWYNLINQNPFVKFYDYTKNPNRTQTPNYHITFSYSSMQSTRIEHYKSAIAKGINIAIPVVRKDFDAAIKLEKCFSMDDTDLRFLDKGKGSFGILKAKKTKGEQIGKDEQFLLSLNDLKILINSLTNNHLIAS